MEFNLVFSLSPRDETTTGTFAPAIIPDNSALQSFELVL
jgi:hypothetical protein